jgi:uncharacterized protein YbjT (DUF2867 family)
MNIFIAGASGAIGRRLTPLLTAAGYTLHGITRDPEKVAALEAAGVHASVVDVYDAAALRAAVGAVAPEYVIHQLTDLPQSNAGGLTKEMGERNARVRVEGTKNLIAAALEAGVRYVVAQSLITCCRPRTARRGRPARRPDARLGDRTRTADDAITAAGRLRAPLRAALRAGNLVRRAVRDVAGACRRGRVRDVARNRAARAGHLQYRGRVGLCEFGASARAARLDAGLSHYFLTG